MLKYQRGAGGAAAAERDVQIVRGTRWTARCASAARIRRWTGEVGRSKFFIRSKPRTRPRRWRCPSSRRNRSRSGRRKRAWPATSAGRCDARGAVDVVDQTAKRSAMTTFLKKPSHALQAARPSGRNRSVRLAELVEQVLRPLDRARPPVAGRTSRRARRCPKCRSAADGRDTPRSCSSSPGTCGRTGRWADDVSGAGRMLQCRPGRHARVQVVVRKPST